MRNIRGTQPLDPVFGVEGDLARALQAQVRFGKYIGHRLIEVPLSYLQWLLESHAANPKLRADAKEILTVDAEMDYRPRSCVGVLVNWPAVVRVWYEEMLDHYDGDEKAAKVIEEGRDLLVGLCRGDQE